MFKLRIPWPPFKKRRMVKFQLRIPWPPFKVLCSSHVEKMVRYFAQRGAIFLDIAEMRWRNQFDELIWTEVEQTAHRLRKRATKSHKMRTERLIEQVDDGRVIMISVAPARSEEYLIRSFPRGDYCEFYRIEHNRFHEIPNWVERDFVHWMFLWDEEHFDVHLLYELSLKMRQVLIGYQVVQAKKRGEKEPFYLKLPPRIIPESFVRKVDFQKVADEIWTEEKELYYATT